MPKRLVRFQVNVTIDAAARVEGAIADEDAVRVAQLELQKLCEGAPALLKAAQVMLKMFDLGTAVLTAHGPGSMQARSHSDQFDAAWQALKAAVKAAQPDTAG